MITELPETIETWVSEQVRSGAYQNRDELILASLELMQLEQQALIDELELGFADFAAGRYQTVKSKKDFDSQILTRVKAQAT